MNVQLGCFMFDVGVESSISSLKQRSRFKKMETR